MAFGNTVYSYTEKLEYDGSNFLIYQGWALPGTATDEAKWRIVKLTWNGSGLCTDIQFANGKDSFDSAWDLRATYSYS